MSVVDGFVCVGISLLLLLLLLLLLDAGSGSGSGSGRLSFCCCGLPGGEGGSPPLATFFFHAMSCIFDIPSGGAVIALRAVVAEVWEVDALLLYQHAAVLGSKRSSSIASLHFVPGSNTPLATPTDRLCPLSYAVLLHPLNARGRLDARLRRDGENRQLHGQLTFRSVTGFDDYSMNYNKTSTPDM